MHRKVIFFFFLLVSGLSNTTFAQTSPSLIRNHFQYEETKTGMLEEDFKDFMIYDEHRSEKLNCTYVYACQQYKGIEVYNAVANFVVKEGKVYTTGNSFERNISERILTTSPKISPEEAIYAAARQLEISLEPFSVALEKKDKKTYIFRADKISHENIHVKLMFLPLGEDIRLVWDLNIYVLSKKHYWSVRVDALTGELLDKADRVIKCQFEAAHPASHASHEYMHPPSPPQMMMAPPPVASQYHVYDLPVESPNHGPRTMVTEPSDPLASPFGWHDDNGLEGADYTITKGNNVYAYEDIDGDDIPGHSPDGGVALNFDFALNLNQPAAGYQDAAITNLFYMNNKVHDIWYHYGFDEASGNFQENNYGKGGLETDMVIAEAQDGGGSNNANILVSMDGISPRMQMYLWPSFDTEDLLKVNSPGNISGTYPGMEATLGVPIPVAGLTGDLALFDDGIPDENDACEDPVNTGDLSGKIAVIRRGSCVFVDKIVRAENAGAIGVIMVNNVPNNPVSMGGTDPGIGIPSIMVHDTTGAKLIAEMNAGSTVNVTLQPPMIFERDGDFDNGIIIHEYGHGISIRLTGGASNTSCLSNAEQMGEGWSDWFAMMLTMEPGDARDKNRGIGTYVLDHPIDSDGVRPAPYNTDMSVNGYTYDDTNNDTVIHIPHGIGFVWATMLWDLTWAMIDEYGYDPDLYHGNGGNNMVIHLVTTALKVQPCSPGFVDARDAILQADLLLYGGANHCLIWNVFANRGLGYSADQGSSDDRTDQVEAFDVPPGYQDVTSSETVEACGSYTWPANGQTYISSGTHVEQFTTVTGCDSTVTLHLTIADQLTRTEKVQACESYTWKDGNTYTSNNNTATHTIPNVGGCDSVITLDLTINNGSSGVDAVNACDSYTWIDGNTYMSDNNTATYVLTNAEGCDSLVTLDLVITTIDTSVTDNSPTLVSNAEGATSYQWLDCEDHFKPISEETKQTFTATSSGSYAVEVKSKNCTDTTACKKVVVVGILGSALENALSVHPNPTFGKVVVTLEGVYDYLQVSLFDARGRRTKQKEVRSSRSFEVEIDDVPGYYFLEIETPNNQKARLKIVKE